jgi:hypothetical protein
MKIMFMLPLFCTAGSAKSAILQYATLSLVPNNKCNESYISQKKVNRGVQDNMICAGDPQGMMDTCNVSSLKNWILSYHNLPH